MEFSFDGLSADLSDADKSTLKKRIEAEKKQWMKAAQNDPEFVASVESKAKGKVYNEVERKLKQATGLKFEDIDAELKGGERFETMVKTAVSSIKATKDQTNQDLQDQLLAEKEITRKLREEEIPKIQSKAEQKVKRSNIATKLTEKFGGMNIIKERLVPARRYAQAILDADYKLDWLEDEKTVGIKTKADLDPVINDKTATLDDVLKHILNEGGFIQKSKGDPKDHQQKPGFKPGTEDGQWSENTRRMAEEHGVALD